jgi:hypothetical protein
VKVGRAEGPSVFQKDESKQRNPKCYDSVHRLDDRVNLTIETRQTRLVVSHSKVVVSMSAATQACQYLVKLDAHSTTTDQDKYQGKTIGESYHDI